MNKITNSYYKTYQRALAVTTYYRWTNTDDSWVRHTTLIRKIDWLFQFSSAIKKYIIKIPIRSNQYQI